MGCEARRSAARWVVGPAGRCRSTATRFGRLSSETFRRPTGSERSLRPVETPPPDADVSEFHSFVRRRGCCVRRRRTAPSSATGSTAAAVTSRAQEHDVTGCYVSAAGARSHVVRARRIRLFRFRFDEVTTVRCLFCG